jgi:2-C-methyl-D-erythritol 4-phosphate cytidylyltransferase/2-C-methyl-D-erythritol 2,4-cyclodiphosphate synthase
VQGLDFMGLSVAALVVAAGRGVRSGGGLPKQYRKVGGDAVLRLSISRFLQHSGVSQVQKLFIADVCNFF